MILMWANTFREHWKGWALKIETFWGPETATSEARDIWGQKSRDFRTHPFQWPSFLYVPSYRPFYRTI